LVTTSEQKVQASFEFLTSSNEASGQLQFTVIASDSNIDVLKSAFEAAAALPSRDAENSCSPEVIGAFKASTWEGLPKLTLFTLEKVDSLGNEEAKSLS
jgi:hypothetical protein